MTIKWIKRLSPSVARQDLAAFIRDRSREAVPLTADTILQSLYSPPFYDQRVPLARPTYWSHKRVWKRKNPGGRSAQDPLPLPPEPLTQGHGSGEAFLSRGETTSANLRRVFRDLQIQLEAGSRVMDWGCASGRVLRHFASEARVSEFWGVDQAGPAITWAKEYLSPPFRFVTCSQLPHLPFPDRTFDIVYAISVFTHIAHLADAWIMEFRRILAPGGYALFTIHDEHTALHLANEGDPRAFGLEGEDLPESLAGDVIILEPDPEYPWDLVNVFYSTEWIAKEWGQYLDVVSFLPHFEWYQTLVILRKPT